MAAFGSLTYGAAVDYYTQGAGGRAGGTNYYTGASSGGEPAGRWSGKGAEALGLVGDVDAKTMQDLYERGITPDGSPFGVKARSYRTAEEITADKLAAEPNALPERVREIQREAERSVRQSNSFADYTFSLSKDLTAQHTAAAFAEEQARQSGDQLGQEHYRLVRETIEDAGYAGSAAAVGYLEENAGYARTGRHGKGSTGRWIEAHDWTVATFFQHTSRENDPQLHYHNPILLNVKARDGKVRKIDTTLIKDNRAAATAHGARVVQEMITEKLGWTFSPRADGNGHELDNVDQDVKDLFSARTNNITEGVKPLVEEYEQLYGVQPNAIALTRLKKKVSLDQRPKKHGPGGETREESLVRFDDQLRREIGEGLARLAAKSGTLKPAPVPENFSPRAVITRAVARVQEAKSTFTRSDLTRAVEAELPAYLGVGPESALRVIETLTDHALASCTQVTNTKQYRVPSDFRLDNGQSAYQRPTSTKFSSDGHISSERALADATVERGRAAVDLATTNRWLMAHEAIGMSVDQQAAIRGIMSSGAALSTLVGPAGAGKTFVLGGLSEAWHATSGGRVYGLATSEQATQVLRGEGVQAKNVAQWLGSQRRLAEGRPMPQDQQWQIQPTDIVVPDEASMADTDKLAEIKSFVDQAGARLLLTGDPKQLSAVGAGGAMDLVVNTGGADVYELTEVRRFGNTWEGDASLKLRDGDQAAIDQYAMHDRIKTGGTEEESLAVAAKLYVGDRLNGKSAVVITPTNTQAAIVNGLVRDELVERGWVEPAGVFLARDGNFAGVGDIVKCRKVIWTPGNELRNQGRYVVKEVLADGGLRVTEEGTGVERTVEKAYADEFVELGYAGTVHSVQGMTCDIGIPVISEGQSLESMYPAMTRGRERNTAVVVTEKEVLDPRTQSTHQHQPLDAAGVFRNIMETEAQDTKAALTTMAEDVERLGSLRTVTDLYEESMRQFCRDRTGRWLDHLVVEEKLTEEQRGRLAAESGTEQLGRLLRVVEQAGHDPKEALAEAVGTGQLDDARRISQVLHHRISARHKDSLTIDPDASVMPPADAPVEYREHFEELTDIIRERRDGLGREVAQDPPVWAIETLGLPPEDVFERAEWEDRAGHIAAFREQTGWTDEIEPLGPAPGIGKTETRAQWAQAWSAAGRPEATAEEHHLSEGALRNRVASMQRENAALPPNVYDEMRAVEAEIYASQHLAAEARNAADLEEDDFQAAVMREKAAEFESYVDRWEAKRTGLQEQDDARRVLMERSATTRDLGQRAFDELVANRGVDVDNEPDRVSAEEWLKLEAETRIEDDQHRDVVEEDLAENQLVENERVDEIRAGVIAVSDDGLPGQVPSDEEVAVGVLKTQMAWERAADEANFEAAGQGQPDQVELEHHEQVVQQRAEETWAEAKVQADLVEAD